MICVRTGLPVYVLLHEGGLCQDWSVSVCYTISRWFCVRTGLSVYVGSTVTGGLCQDWSVSVHW